MQHLERAAIWGQGFPMRGGSLFVATLMKITRGDLLMGCEPGYIATTFFAAESTARLYLRGSNFYLTNNEKDTPSRRGCRGDTHPHLVLFDGVWTGR